MSLIYKLIILALIGALASPFFIKKPDGTPLLTLKQIMRQADSSTAKLGSSSSNQTKLYRYKDDKGRWQYTDRPPESQAAEKVTLNKPITSLKTITLPEGFGEPKEAEQRFDPTEDTGARLPITTAPLNKVPEMLDQIEGIQEKFDARQSALDAATH